MKEERRASGGLTRRDLLRLVPGVAAGLTLGCPRPPGRLQISTSGIGGSIVGASHEVGHRIRRPPQSAPRRGVGAQPIEDVPVVIVGGGMAGLSAGWKLRRSGFEDFVILELEGQPGGNSRWGENGVSAYPWGAHYLPVPTPESTAVREVVEEMGLVVGVGEDGAPVYDSRHLCHFPQERVFVAGEWRGGLSPAELQAGPEESADIAAFEAQVERYRRLRDSGGRLAFALPMALSSSERELSELDGISMRHYLDRAGWVSATLRWYVDYCCRDDYGATLESTSAWAGWHYFASRPQAVEYLTWPEGNGRIVRHLVEAVSAKLRCDSLVLSVERLAEPDADGWAAQIEVLATRDDTVKRLRAKRVIYALPRFTAPYVLRGYELDGIEEFTYSPWMVANLTVERLPDGAAWDNVIYHSPSLGYIVATHQDLTTAPGASVLTYYLPMTSPDPKAARRELLGRSWDDWVALILQDLQVVHPDIVERVSQVDVMLWGHAMIRPVPGFITGEARRRSLEPWGPVRFAHSDMSGLSLFEEAQYRGVRAAEELMAELGHPFASSLVPGASAGGRQG